jgi:hypothetical protein
MRTNQEIKNISFKKITLNDNTNIKMSKNESNGECNQVKKYPAIIIPVGTQICPERRCCGNYWMTLNEAIIVGLKNPIQVNINGSLFHVVDQSTPFPGNELIADNCIRIHPCIAPCNVLGDPTNNLQSFTVPGGTVYHINDCLLDPLGLAHVLEVDDQYRIRPNSIVTLLAGTTIALKPMMPVPGTLDNLRDIHMTLRTDTDCTVYCYP